MVPIRLLAALCLAFCLWSRSPLDPPSPLLWESFLPSEGQFQGYLIPQWNFLILLNQCNPSLLWEPQLYLCSFWNQSIHVRNAPVLVCEVIWTPISSKGTQLHRTHSVERLLCDSILWRWFSLSIVSDSCNLMDCSLPGSSVHGILQATILEWVAISVSRGSSWPRNRTRVSCIAGWFFTDWATREAWHHTRASIF